MSTVPPVGAELSPLWSPFELPMPVDRWVVIDRRCDWDLVGGYYRTIIRIADLPDDVDPAVLVPTAPYITVLVHEPCLEDHIDWGGVHILLDEIERLGVGWVSAVRRYQ